MRHRLRKAIFIGIGLAVGIGLVITVSAASTGVRNAQASVLRALYGVGTDVTATRARSFHVVGIVSRLAGTSPDILMGWRAIWIVGEVLGRSVIAGIAGALACTGLGLGRAAFVAAFAAPRHSILSGGYDAVPVYLSVPAKLSVVALAMALGIASGLLASTLYRTQPPERNSCTSSPASPRTTARAAALS